MWITTDNTDESIEDIGSCADCSARFHCFFYEINAQECHYDAENREDNQRWNDERKYGKQWR